MTHNIETPNPIIGTPFEDGLAFPGKQGYGDTCAVRCQEFIIRQFTGSTLPEDFYIKQAIQHGWYVPGHGTPVHDIGNLLELNGIPVHKYEHANILNLTAELARGHKVIIGVESDELWHPENPQLREMLHRLGYQGSVDHAVVVSGIDTSDSNNYKVILSDPGTGEVAARYPMEQFLEAWRGSKFFMVATQDPPPEHLHLPEMAHFDYHSGHIDQADHWWGEWTGDPHAHFPDHHEHTGWHAADGHPDHPVSEPEGSADDHSHNHHDDHGGHFTNH